MFHTVLVVTLFCSERDMGWSQSTRKWREKNARLRIFTSMTTTRLLTSSSRGDWLDGALEDIAQFKRLHKIPISLPIQSELGINSSRGQSSQVPNHAPVLDTDIIKVFINEANLLDPRQEFFWVLKTAASVCMSRRILAVGSGPSERLSKSFISYISRSSQRKHTCSCPGTQCSRCQPPQGSPCAACQVSVCLGYGGRASLDQDSWHRARIHKRLLWQRTNLGQSCHCHPCQW